jgi:restriction system protein
MENFDHLHSVYTYREQLSPYRDRLVAEIRHNGLGTFRVFKDTNGSHLQNKINAQFHRWDLQWAKQVVKDLKTELKDAQIKLAEETTKEAKQAQIELKNVLEKSLHANNTVNWNQVKRKDKFVWPNLEKKFEKELEELQEPKEPSKELLPDKPLKKDFKTKYNLFDLFSASSKAKKASHSKKKYKEALANWKIGVQKINESNIRLNNYHETALKNWEKQKSTIKDKYKKLEEETKNNEEQFYKEQLEYNTIIDELSQAYPKGSAEAVVPYYEIVLNNSQYPDFFPQKFDLEYNFSNKLLIVDYSLPAIDSFPTMLEVKYFPVKKELKESHLSELQLEKIYDETLYQITLRTIYELFKTDQINALDTIVFNGWVESISKSTGKMANSCILTISTSKDEFTQLDLSKIDPRACFKSLKGVSSTKLSSIAPVKPFIQINKSDKRFVDSKNLADGLDEGSNLAAMDWESFEHLIREIFEKEFSSNGGEVKVTQSSRDGGVDAVAFDPDPIRGGKIVIQAKRYTNTVGVSAVRDLYGTVLNEGATKGILVTTADYGPDAYQFAKNKPLTLMNGANLLFLMGKHGHKARINISEAKQYHKTQKSR